MSNLGMVAVTDEWLSDDVPSCIQGFNEAVNDIEDFIQRKGTVEEQKNAMKLETFKMLLVAEFLDKVASGTGITKTVGGSVGTVGGICTIAGVCLAPFTAGVSLFVTAAGVVAGVAGAATSFTASMVELGWDNSKNKDIKAAIEQIQKEVTELSDLLRKYSEYCENTKQFLDTEKGKRYLKGWFKKWGNATTKATSLGANTAYGVLRTVKLGKAIQLCKIANPAAVQEVLSVSKSVVTSEIKLGSRVLVQAGSKGAVALGVVGGVASIAFGIWDIVSGAKRIRNGSETACKIRSDVKEMNEDLDILYDYLDNVYNDIVNGMQE